MTPTDTTPDAALLEKAEQLYAPELDPSTGDFGGRVWQFAHTCKDLATALRESRAREVAEPYRHALEQRLICSNLPLLTGDADADLMRFVFHEQEIALSPEAGVIAELKEQRNTALSWTATYTNMDVYRRCLAAAIARAEKAEAEREQWKLDSRQRSAVCDERTAERDALRAQLAEANATIALCADNTAAADLAQEVEFLKAEKEALREELARVRRDAAEKVEAAFSEGYKQGGEDEGDCILISGAERFTESNARRAALALGGEGQANG